MARLNDAYKKLVEDLNQNIKNKEDLAYVKEKLADFVAGQVLGYDRFIF